MCFVFGEQTLDALYNLALDALVQEYDNEVSFPGKVPVPNYIGPLFSYDSPEQASLHLKRIKGDALERHRLIAGLFFMMDISPAVFAIFFTPSQLNDALGGVLPPSTPMATRGYVELHERAVFYKHAFGIDSMSDETRNIMRIHSSNPELEQEMCDAYAQTILQVIFHYSTMEMETCEPMRNAYYEALRAINITRDRENRRCT